MAHLALATASRAALGPLSAALVLSTAVAQPALTSVRVATGFARPIYVGAPNGDEDRLFVAEQHSGLVRIVLRGDVLATPFLDVKSRILTGSERGLLGVAFHPDFVNNGLVYVNYTRTGDGATIVERFTVSSSNPHVVDPNSGTIIFGPVNQPQSNHNAGCIAFGPGGYLYIAFGDGGGAGDRQCNAQNGQLFLGKVVRIDVDGGTPYAVPPTNPFVGNPAFRDEIWTYGWRNPWRFSFDRGTGDMYVGDVGQGAREEVSFQAGSSTGGENFGWKIMEGTNCFSTANCVNPPPCNSPALELPIHDYASTGANCTVIGGYVYRGCGIPGLEGTYFFADYCARSVWSLRYDGQSVTQLTNRTTELVPNAGSIGQVTSFGEDSCGEIYLCDLDGDVFKIVPAGPPAAVNLGFATPGSNGRPTFELCGMLGAGQTAELILRNAPPATAAALVLSTANQPTPLAFGTVVPVPPQIVQPFITDGGGRVQFTVTGGLGPAVIYGQWGILDSGVPTGITLSNALQVTFP